MMIKQTFAFLESWRCRGAPTVSDEAVLNGNERASFTAGAGYLTVSNEKAE
jgi:hypothetical protein